VAVLGDAIGQPPGRLPERLIRERLEMLADGFDGIAGRALVHVRRLEAHRAE
jgi:hypothetical protein